MMMGENNTVIDSMGPFRFVERSDGLYIAGHGMYIKLESGVDAEALVEELHRVKEMDEFFTANDEKIHHDWLDQIGALEKESE